MFPSNTYLKVIRYLNLTLADEPLVRAALINAEATPELEAEVTEILGQIETIEAALLAERSSPNNAMIRADVVEWQPGARTKGMVTAANILKKQLANLLELTYEPKSYQGCGTTVISTNVIL